MKNSSLKLFFCVIAVLAYPCYSAWSARPTLPNLSDANGWGDAEYYSTIRSLVTNNTIWVFARGPNGVEVFTFDPATNLWSTRTTLSDLADSNGWGSSPSYYSTIRVVYLSNAFWLIARNALGLVIYKYDPALATWTKHQGNPRFSDIAKWDQPEYYSTIQAFNSSGLVWVFARGSSGEEIHTYNPGTDTWDTLPVLTELSDANNWGTNPRYYSTIQVVPLQENFWVLARGPNGIQVYRYVPSSKAWSTRQSLPNLSDQNGWGAEEYYSTIHSIAHKNYIWLFARGANGLETWMHDPNSNIWIQKVSLAYLSDANNWDNPEYYSTIQPVGLDSSIALLARGSAGLEYHSYNPSTNLWATYATLPNLSDANQWDNVQYYSTIKGINLKNKVTVLARGIGGLEVYDEY